MEETVIVETSDARALWVSAELLAIPTDLVTQGTSVEFRAHPELRLNNCGSPTEELLTKAPELARDSYQIHRVQCAVAEHVGTLRETVANLLRTAPIVDVCAAGIPVAATRTQYGRALDDLYADAIHAPMGVVWTDSSPSLHLWAPTAVCVELELTHPEQGNSVDEDTRLYPARFAPDTGMWTVEGEKSWYGGEYVWRVQLVLPPQAETPPEARQQRGTDTTQGERLHFVGPTTATGVLVTNRVTDPCSVALTPNSRRSVLVTPDDPDGIPEGWGGVRSWNADKPQSHSIWEVHVADFSARDTGVPEKHRGTYMAFTHADSAGMKHLRALVEAGMDTVQLLPTYDFATVIEESEGRDPASRADELLPAPHDPASPQPQARISAWAARDSYNWGYDPYHWNVPEGSYAADSDTSAVGRLRQHRTMILALHEAGARVVLDVVYNHMNASGQAPTSVFDRIVPGYHHRLDPQGRVEATTCNDDVACERMMTGRLIVESVLHWARHFHVDGFRFDLMGHIPLELMGRIRQALNALTREADGVDGRAIVLYGEGWDFGSVSGDALFPQARQANLAGSAIGAFNDRLRDAVRGGGPFDLDQRAYQGWATGLSLAPNAIAAPDTRLLGADDLARLGHLSDLVALSMCGAGADTPILCHDGIVRRGRDIDFRGVGAGWTQDPHECVNYVDAHDNETLFDVLAWKLPVETPMSERIRVNTLALATVALGQGRCFWHAGTEILRSKSLDRDSYDSGLYFNAVDWTMEDNGWGKGLPIERVNGAQWEQMRSLLGDENLKPTRQDIDCARRMALDLLRLRSSTPLFHLASGEEVRARITRPALQVISGGVGPCQTTVPGTVVLRIRDEAEGPLPDLDPAVDLLLVALNPAPWEVSVRVEGGAGADMKLHPLCEAGADRRVRSTVWERRTGELRILGRTAVVLVAGNKES